jgi:DNA (cytosine-5)-methyltransferase 1
MADLTAGDEAEGALGTTVAGVLALSPSGGASRLALMDAISLFSGAGGLDLGCEAAGFETLAVVEADATARETILSNRRGFFPRLRDEAVFFDILETDPGDVLERCGLKRGEVSLLHGGPPCTPFSKSGYWLAYKRAGEDPRASLLDEYVRVLRGVQPQAFLMENVYGLAYRNQNRAVLDRFLNAAREAGYVVEFRIVLAADLGIPQLRQRLFCIGIRRDLIPGSQRSWEFPWPEPTHSGPHETRTGWDADLPLHESAGDVLASLPDDLNPPEPEEIVEGTYADAFRAVPPGENYLFWTAERGHKNPRFRWRSRYWSFLLKLHPDKPSPTIQGQPGPWVGPFHWDDRRLRVAEVKRLMTFPDSFTVLGTRREQQLQLGNAVPPDLGEAVAAAIADELRSLGCAPSPELALAA